MMRTPWFKAKFAEMCREILDDPDHDEKESFIVICQHPIGWSSTAELAAIEERNIALEEFQPNTQSTALRVRDVHESAPQTNIVTVIASFLYEDRQNKVIVRSLYPGPDIGELKGDIAKNEGVVFFDWNNPGDTQEAWPVETISEE